MKKLFFIIFPIFLATLSSFFLFAGSTSKTGSISEIPQKKPQKAKKGKALPRPVPPQEVTPDNSAELLITFLQITNLEEEFTKKANSHIEYLQNIMEGEEPSAETDAMMQEVINDLQNQSMINDYKKHMTENFKASDIEHLISLYADGTLHNFLCAWSEQENNWGDLYERIEELERANTLSQETKDALEEVARSLVKSLEFSHAISSSGEGGASYYSLSQLIHRLALITESESVESLQKLQSKLEDPIFRRERLERLISLNPFSVYWEGYGTHRPAIEKTQRRSNQGNPNSFDVVFY